MACATCHDPEKGLSDGRRLSVGVEELTRHSMSLWNVAYNRWFFWDGRADSLWAQALQPLEDPREHGSSRVEVVRVIAEDPGLAEAYRAVFGTLPDVADRARFPVRARPVADDPDHADARAGGDARRRP